MMLEGDEILQKPKRDDGFWFSSYYMFHLNDLETRGRMFPEKKRGRPAKSEEEKTSRKKSKNETKYRRLRKSDQDMVKREWMGI